MTAFINPFVIIYHVEISYSFKNIDISLSEDKKFVYMLLLQKHKYLTILNGEC